MAALGTFEAPNAFTGITLQGDVKINRTDLLTDITPVTPLADLKAYHAKFVEKRKDGPHGTGCPAKGPFGQNKPD